MRERQIEQRLTQAVRKRRGLCPKWVSPGLDGVPDRIILLPGGRIAFAELKAPGKPLRPLQRRRKAQLEALAADGTLAKISEKWFDKDITTIGK